MDIGKPSSMLGLKWIFRPDFFLPRLVKEGWFWDELKKNHTGLMDWEEDHRYIYA